MNSKAKPSYWMLALLPALLTAGPVCAVTIFSEGMLTPETISQAPGSFGAHAGSYFIPDAARGLDDPNTHNVWVVPQSGGPPVAFSTGNVHDILAGLFLPATPEWGVRGGRYLTVGRDTAANGASLGVAHTYDALGNQEFFGAYPDTPFNQVLLARAGFGAVGGQLLVSEVENGGRIHAIAPDGQLTPFAESALVTQVFGLAFAPDGFGSVGGQLLASDPFAGTIIAIDALGAATSFATVSLFAGQTGLRQMAFAPTDFLLGLGIPGDLLLVSISGSLTGGGTLGDVVALNPEGEVVASLRVVADLDKFDPRGMFFIPEGLLISDASDPIILVTAEDFRPGRLANVPEPSLPLLLAIGFAGLGLTRKYRARA